MENVILFIDMEAKGNKADAKLEIHKSKPPETSWLISGVGLPTALDEENMGQALSNYHVIRIVKATILVGRRSTNYGFFY